MLLILAFPLRQSIEITKIQLLLLVNGSFQFVAVYPSYKAMGLLRTAHRIFHASAIETAREYEWLSLTHCMNFPFASKTGCHTTIAKYSLNRLRYPWLAYRVCIFTPTRPCLRCFYHFPWTRGDRGKQTEKTISIFHIEFERFQRTIFHVIPIAPRISLTYIRWEAAKSK